MDDRKRKRGIKASREKLESAMLAAGFETQLDLALQIASNENLNKPPRDLVNKVFREQAVSPHNLARIAKALGVDAYTLYLSGDIAPFSHVVSTQQLQTGTTHQGKVVASPRRNSTFWLAAVAATIIGFSLFWLYPTAQQHASPPPQTFSTKLNTPLGRVLLMVQAPDDIRQFAGNLVSELSALEHINANLATAPGAYTISPDDALRHWQAHAILRIELLKGHYYQLLTAKLASRKHNVIIFQKVIRGAELSAQAASLQATIVTQTQRFSEGESLLAILSANQQAAELYLQGKDNLFTSHSASSFFLARDLFTDALKLDNNFAEAYAELCRIYVRVSWIQDETASLEQAADYCQKATALKPEALSVTTAQAELLSRTGNTEQAITLLHSLVTADSQDSDALAVRAGLHMLLFGQDGADTQGELAETFANNAILLAPDHWQALNSLGNLYFMQGKTRQAKSLFQAATAVIKHEIILANLGTLQLCHDELSNAMQTYSELVANFENNYIGYENLGSVYHFQQSFEQALKYKLIAIEKQPEVSIHQIWSSLAEIYLQLGQNTLAIQNYTKAITLIERDELLENISLSDQLHKLYYQAKLQQLKVYDQPVSDLEKQTNYFLAAQADLGLKAKSHLAWLLGLAGRTAEKQKLWQQISQVCEVYQRSPELLLQATDSNNTSAQLFTSSQQTSP